MNTFFKFALLGGLGVLSQVTWANSAPVQESLNNFNQHCVRDLPVAVLDKKQFSQYKFYYEVVPETQNTTPMPQAVEKAITAQKMPFTLIQSGCEFINQELIVTLPSHLVERQGRFCASCAVEVLQQQKKYFLKDQSHFLNSGLQILAPKVKNTAIRLNHDYSDDSGDALSQTIRIKSLKKIPQQAGWQIHLITSVGPL